MAGPRPASPRVRACAAWVGEAGGVRAGLARPPPPLRGDAAGEPRAWLSAATASPLSGPEVPGARRSRLPRPWCLWATRRGERLSVGSEGDIRARPRLSWPGEAGVLRAQALGRALLGLQLPCPDL